MKKIIFVLTLFGCSTGAHAMFCPNNFNQINIGDTTEQVKKQCGNPDVEKKIEGEDNGPQEWNFYVRPQMKRYTETRTNSGAEASVKMSIALNQGKVINITVNGMSLATTTICGPSVSIGDTSKTVKSACGDPVFINKSSNQEGAPKPKETVEYQYNSTPPATLVFVGGFLQERR
ncbi:MAG TPA: hypothetical protein VLJ15_08965 [Gammaproteobacteria bacterium]|nr:hypothetical protein [Gammaproteobacteria bacterium]